MVRNGYRRDQFFEVARRGGSTGITDVYKNGRVGIKIIEPGQGATGFYTPEVLADTAARGLFNDVPIMWNHPGEGLRSERPNIKELVGWIDKGAKYLNNGPNGPGVYGTAKVRGPQRADVYSLVDSPSGLSIHADGELEREGDTTSKVLRIDKVSSVDLVVKPGAGGAITEVIESQREPQRREIVGLKYKGQMLIESADGYNEVEVPVFSDANGNSFYLDESNELQEEPPNLRGDPSLRRQLQTNVWATEQRRKMRNAGGLTGIATKTPGRRRALGAGIAAGAGLAGIGAGSLMFGGKRKESMIDEETGDIWDYYGNIDEDELTEDDLEEARGLRRLAKMNPFRRKSRTERVVNRTRKTGRAVRRGVGRVAQSGAARMGAAGAAGAGAGAAGMAAYNRRREGFDEDELDEEEIFEDVGIDEENNVWTYGGNIYEDDDLDEDELQEEPPNLRGDPSPRHPRSHSPAPPSVLAPGGSRADLRASFTSSKKGGGGRGRFAKGSSGRRRAIGAGIAAGAGAAGIGAGYLATRRKEEELEEELNNLYGIVEEMNEHIKYLQNGPREQALIAESANLAMDYGSDRSRELAMQMANNMAASPQEASYIGNVISEAINEDRMAHGTHWSNWNNTTGARQDWHNFTPRGMNPMEAANMVGISAIHGSGGGNSALIEEDGVSQFTEAEAQMIRDTIDLLPPCLR